MDDASHIDFHGISREVLFGQLWQDSRLNKRDRSLVTLAIIMSHGTNLHALYNHIIRGVAHGLMREEIEALVPHVAFYAGWPTAEWISNSVNASLRRVDLYEPCTKACCNS